MKHSVKHNVKHNVETVIGHINTKINSTYFNTTLTIIPGEFSILVAYFNISLNTTL